MKNYAQPIPSIDLPADTTGAAVIPTTGAVSAFDWPQGAKVARFAGTGGFYLNPYSTGANIPTGSSAGSTAPATQNVYVPPEDPRTIQIPGGSTGYSICAPVANTIVTTEFWSK